MRATGWVRKESAAARRARVRVTAQATISDGGASFASYGVVLRFHVEDQPSRDGERLVINATLEETREIIAKLTEAMADGEHYREDMAHTRRPG